MSIITIKSNSNVPSSHKITGTTGPDLITIYPTVTYDLLIDGLGGGDAISIAGNQADTVVYHSNDLLYASIGTGLQTIDAGSASLFDLRGVFTTTDPHVGPVITGFDLLDLTVSGAGTLAPSHTVRIDPLGVDIFAGLSKNPLTHTVDTMIINAGQNDTISMGTGWTQQPFKVIGGFTYHDYTHSLTINHSTEIMTLLVENRAPIAHDYTPAIFNEDNLVSYSLNSLSLITDADSDPVHFTKVNGVAISGVTSFMTSLGFHGTIDAAGYVTVDTSGPNLNAYNAAPGAILHDSFTYQVADNFGGVSNTATIHLNELNDTDPPVAVADPASTIASTPISVNVLVNDSLGDDAPIGTIPTLALLSGFSADGAALSINPVTHTVHYDPTGSSFLQSLNTSQTVTDTFQYKIITPQGTSTVTDTVSVTGVAPVDVVENVQSITPSSTTATEDSPFNSGSLFTHTDIDDTLTYSLTAGHLPTGLTLNANGTISGTVTDDAQIGSYNVTVTATNTDPNNIGGSNVNSAMNAFTITVNDATNEISLNAAPAPLSAQEGAQTSHLFDASTLFSSDDPMTYAADPSHPLPNGLTIDASTGIISGTPTDLGGEIVGPYTVDIIATNMDPHNSGETITSHSFTINVADASNEIISNTVLPVSINENDSITISAFTSDDVMSLSMDPSSPSPLPAGLSFDSNGNIIGTITAEAGVYTIIVDTMNLDPNNTGDPVVTNTITFNVADPPPVANPDTFTLEDTVNPTLLALGNVLTNDTNSDPLDMQSVVQTAFTGQTFAGSGLAGLGTAATGGVDVATMPLGAGEIAHFSISATGALANEASPMAAELIIGADGSVTLIKNNAFDFLPTGETLTLHFTYGIAESDNLAGTPVSSTLDITITGTDTNDVFVSTPGTAITGGLGNDTIYGAGAGQGNTVDYSADVLGDAARTFSSELAVAQAATGGSLFNYSLSLQTHPALFGGLTSGIVAQGVNAGAVDGTDLIVADLVTIVNQVLNPTPNSTSTVDFINFAGHTYQLYNGVATTSSNEWIAASIPAAGQDGALIVGGDFTSSAGGSYYVLQGNMGNDIIIGGNSSSTASSYGYFLIGEGGNNVLIGGANMGSMDYYVAGTDNLSGGFAVPFPQSAGNNVLIGGSNMGTGSYYMLGAQGNDILMAGSNALGNTYDLYYFSGGGGTNLFVSNTGKHVFDGSSGSNGASIHDGNINGIHDINDSVQYHQDVLGGVAVGDVRAFIDAATPTFAQMAAVVQAIDAGLTMNYNFSMVFDPFATSGGILVDAQNAAATLDGHDIIVVDSVTGQSSIQNIAFNESSLLTGTNHIYTLYNGPTASDGTVVVIAASGSDALMVGGTNSGSAYSLTGNDGNDILQGGTNSGSGAYTLDGGTGHNILIGGDNSGSGTYTLSESSGNNVLIGGNNLGSGVYILTISDMVGSPGVTGGTIGNEATAANSTNAQVTLSSDILDVGTSLGGHVLSIIGTAYGASAETSDANGTFGNYASDGFTAISAQVNIHDNILNSDNTAASDTLLIQAHAVGGNAGLTPWDNSTVNTGANVADGAGSEAISAQAIVDNNDLSGGAAGISMTIDAEATGGNTGPALYANQALNDAVAISAQVTVDGNHLDGHGDLTGDALHIIALATGGSVGSGGFTGNVAGFITTAGGTATSAQAIVDGNVLTEHGTADAILTIEATATGGDGHFFGNYAFAGTVISADVQVDNSTLTGGSGNDMLTIDATANGGVGPNHAESGAIAIDTLLNVSGNVFDGGLGNDTLALLINANPGGSNTGGAGTEIASQITDLNNHMMGGEGNDTLIFNDAAFLTSGSGNILDGGNGFDTLIEQISGANLDLTAPGVANGIVQNVERVDLTGNGNNTLTLDGASVDNLNTSHELFVKGEAGDTASIGAGWGFVGTVTGAGAGDPLAADAAISFSHYTQIVGADIINLYVESAMTIA